MKTLLVLTWAFLKEHPSRSLLTLLATSAAACMVIWVSSGYDSLLQTYDEFSDVALGRYPLAIAPISMNRADFVERQVVDDLLADPAVLEADAMLALDATFRSSGRPSEGAELGMAVVARDTPQGMARAPLNRNNVTLLATDSPQPPFLMVEGEWLSGGNTSGVVVRQDLADAKSLQIGDPFPVQSSHQSAQPPVELEVVGIIQVPTLISAGPYGIPVLTPASAEAFVDLATAHRITGTEDQIHMIAVALRPEADITEFRFRWAPRLSLYATPAQFQESIEIEEALDQAAAARNVKMQSYAATGIALLVSMLVITCTLNMGVTERTRQYALLRAITLTRLQLGMLVFFESLFLGIGGLLIGSLVGIGMLLVVRQLVPTLYYNGIHLGVNTFSMAVIACLGAAVLASLSPIYMATRVRPIDALTSLAKPLRIYQVRAGVLLLAIGLIGFNWVWHALPLSQHWVVIGLAAGMILSTIGFVLLTPSLVVWVDYWLTPVLCRVFRVDRDLIRSQLTPHVWRTSGAAITMALGTGLFIGIQVWGYTMLQAFVPGDWAPDAVIQLAENSSVLPEDVREMAEVSERQFSKVVVEQPRLLEDLTDSAQAATVTRQDNIILVGVEPDPSFAAEDPLFRMEWKQGDPVKAIKALRDNRGCVVPNHFLIDTGMKVGDEFQVVSPEDASKVLTYTIAGSVALPGWHWQTKLTGMRPRTHRAAALVFTDYQTMVNDFQFSGPTHVWFDFSDSQTTADDRVRSKLATLEGRVVSSTEPEGLAAEYAEGPAMISRLVTVSLIRNHINGVARRWIWIISQLPLVTLLIAGVGVLNVLLASVRSRKREYGILISIGFTREELSRAVFLEGILVAVVASFLSIGFGIVAGWSGCELAQYLSFFGGLHPDLVVPPATLLVAVLMIAGFAVLLSFWPARMIGKSRPLELLQS